MPDPVHIQDLWRPALEILILAVLIYFVFKFVRGTRGWPVVIGFVVVLLALFAVTTVLKLQVLRWLLVTASTFFVKSRVRPALRSLSVFVAVVLSGASVVFGFGCLLACCAWGALRKWLGSLYKAGLICAGWAVLDRFVVVEQRGCLYRVFVYGGGFR